MPAMLNRFPGRVSAAILTFLVLLVAYSTRSTAAPPARATTSTLYTAVLASNGQNNTLGTTASMSCAITNVSATSHTVSGELISATGDTLSPPIPVLLDAGLTLTTAAGTTLASIAYCKFTVDGPSSDVRAELQTVYATDTGAVTIASNPAY